MKTLTVRQFATVKRVAQNVNPLVIKKNKIAAKISELNAEYNELVDEIEGHEMGIKSLTGGFISENLVTKKVEDTGKFDKDGKPIKKTSYEPTSIVVFNAQTNMYEIHIAEAPAIDETTPDINEVDDTEEVPATEDKSFDPTFGRINDDCEAE